MAAKTSLLAALLAAIACAAVPHRERLGDVTLRSKSAPQAPPVTLGVQTGRILSGNLDLVIEADQCVRGGAANGLIALCPRVVPPDALTQPGERRERWVGANGSLSIEVEPGGKSLRADGFLSGIGRGGRTIEVALTLPFGTGPEWDELREHPALYAIAAALGGARGDSIAVVQDLPDGGAPPEEITPESN